MMFSGFKLYSRECTLGKQFCVCAVRRVRAESELRRSALCINICLLIFVEFVLFGEQLKQLSAGTVLKYEVQFFLILKTRNHFHEEGMVNVGEDALLRHCVHLLVFFDDVLLFECLQCEQLSVFFSRYETHLRIRAFAYHWVVCVIINRLMFTHPMNDMKFILLIMCFTLMRLLLLITANLLHLRKPPFKYLQYDKKINYKV
jgi:hypothetical protein